MASYASVGRHPFHAMFVPFPIGLLVFSLVSDIVFRAGWGGPEWLDVARYTMAGGIIGALIAAVPELLDYTHLPPGRVSQTATAHMVINLVVVGIFAVDFWFRTRGPADSGVPFGLSILGVLLLTISGWLGGELVYVMGVGVDAPPSARVDLRPSAREQAIPRRTA